MNDMTEFPPQPRLLNDASCVQIGPEAFMPGKDGGTTVQYIKSVCKRCPYFAECNAWALTIPPGVTSAIIGGVSEYDRRRIVAERNRRRIVAAAASKAEQTAAAITAAVVAEQDAAEQRRVA